MIKMLMVLNLSWLLMLSGCHASLLIKEDEISYIKKGILRGYENHRDVKYCSSFLMNKKQIYEFFKRSNSVSEREANTVYDWSPCYIEAGLRNKKHSKIVINALYLGYIEEKESRKYFYCEACDDLFVQ